MTDTEQVGEPDPKLVAFCRDADVLIFDCMYTPEEYDGRDGGARRVGWGHSTFVAGAELAEAGNVKKLILFHHDPEQDDAAVRDKERRARQLFTNSQAAYEGLVLEL
jgi:ribonuclease BN (tRNA processing enzyme)